MCIRAVSPEVEEKKVDCSRMRLVEVLKLSWFDAAGCALTKVESKAHLGFSKL